MNLKGNKLSERGFDNYNTTINLSDKTSVPSKKRFNRPLLKILVLVQFIIIILAGYFFYQYLQEKNKDQNLNVVNEQTAAVKQAVGKLIKLDPSTEPTIATLKDVDALKKENPEFYKDAQNGDILLIYPTRAILYSQKENIIINVAPIINNNDTTTSTTPVPSPTPTNTIKPTAKK